MEQVRKDPINQVEKGDDCPGGDHDGGQNDHSLEKISDEPAEFEGFHALV
jgi:hypothetical protein